MDPEHGADQSHLSTGSGRRLIRAAPSDNSDSLQERTQDNLLLDRKLILAMIRHEFVQARAYAWPVMFATDGITSRQAPPRGLGARTRIDPVRVTRSMLSWIDANRQASACSDRATAGSALSGHKENGLLRQPSGLSSFRCRGIETG